MAGESYAHFGLASSIYTHFTSPIRRYADQIVHRMLEIAIGWQPPDSTLECPRTIGQVARSLNERHAAAKEAERASVALYSLLYFRDRPAVQVGYLVRVKPNGFSVLVPRYGIEGWIFTSPHASAESPLTWDSEAMRLTAPGVTLKSMDKVLVRIAVDTTRVHPRLTMELLDEDTKEPLLERLSKEAASKSTSTEQVSE